MSASIKISEKQLLSLLEEHIMDWVYSENHLNILAKKLLEILANHPSEFLDWSIVDTVSKKYKKLDVQCKKDNELSRIECEKLYYEEMLLNSKEYKDKLKSVQEQRCHYDNTLNHIKPIMDIQ